MIDIFVLLQPIAPLISTTTLRQLSHVIFGILAMTGRVTMLGVTRWAGKGGSYTTHLPLGLKSSGPSLDRYHSDDPSMSVLDLKAHFRGFRYVVEILKMLPQKPDRDLLAAILLQVACLGSIHPAQPAVSTS